MEIVFDKVNYKTGYSLDNLSFSFKTGGIYGLVIEDFSSIYNLITLNKRPNSGTVQIDDLIIKRTNSLNEVPDLKNKVGYVRNVFKSEFSCETVADEISLSMKDHNYKPKDFLKHIKDSLIIAGLDLEFLDRNPNTLSLTEQKKLLFAKTVSYNPEVLIIEDFDKDFTSREKDYFKKILKKLRVKFKKTIILIADNVELFFELVDEVYVIRKGKVVLNGADDIFYSKKLYDYVKLPKIIEFTNYVNSQGHKILKYVDLKELIKELYRKIK